MNQQPDPDPLGQYQFDAFGRFVDLNEMELERYPAPPPVRWVPVDDLASVAARRWYWGPCLLLVATGPA